MTVRTNYVTLSNLCLNPRPCKKQSIFSDVKFLLSTNMIEVHNIWRIADSAVRARLGLDRSEFSLLIFFLFASIGDMLTSVLLVSRPILDPATFFTESNNPTLMKIIFFKWLICLADITGLHEPPTGIEPACVH